MRQPAVEIPRETLAEFCRRWNISELALFGSVLRPDFRPESDVDVLVSFAPEAHWTLLDCVRMREIGGNRGRFTQALVATAFAAKFVSGNEFRRNTGPSKYLHEASPISLDPPRFSRRISLEWRFPHIGETGIFCENS